MRVGSMHSNKNSIEYSLYDIICELFYYSEEIMVHAISTNMLIILYIIY